MSTASHRNEQARRERGKKNWKKRRPLAENFREHVDCGGEIQSPVPPRASNELFLFNKFLPFNGSRKHKTKWG